MMYTLYTLSCCHWERAGADCRIPRMLCIKEELTIGLLEYIEYTANVHRISSPLCGYLGLNMYSQSPCTSSRGDDLCLSEIKLFNGKVWQGPMFFSFARLLVFFLICVCTAQIYRSHDNSVCWMSNVGQQLTTARLTGKQLRFLVLLQHLVSEAFSRFPSTWSTRDLL